MKRLLISLLICLSVLFIALQFLEQEFYASGIRALMLIGLTALYIHVVKKKRLWFFLFLLIFTIAELLNFYAWFRELKVNDIDYLYYFGNTLYILSYTFLIVQVLKTMNIREVLITYPFHIVVLLVLDIFCVLIVTGTAEKELLPNEYALEFFYNIIIMILLSLALLNYIYRDDKKSMNFLIASIFIVFSEVIQLAYFYVAPINMLNVACSIFLVMAFLFFYLQARLVHEQHIEEYHKQDFKKIETQ